MVQDFYFWTVWAAGPVHKKSLGPIMSKVFFMFSGSKIFFFLKTLMRRHKKLRNKFKRKEKKNLE